VAQGAGGEEEVEVVVVEEEEEDEEKQNAAARDGTHAKIFSIRTLYSFCDASTSCTIETMLPMR
jgi:hypothetical protein